MLVKSKLICLITILLLNLIAASSATASNSITTLPALPAISLPSDTNNPDLSNSMNNSWWNKIKSFFGFNVESEQNKLEANNVQNIENSFNNDFPSNNEKLESNQLNTKSHNFIHLITIAYLDYTMMIILISNLQSYQTYSKLLKCKIIICKQN
ncbi:hypothetical protein OTSUT76_0360 [Orientia tsutsugamushi str. UT76]|nr:hypothetical protein OTSUT76_0360 [Orientia tsutsugamushi str. UT76]